MYCYTLASPKLQFLVENHDQSLDVGGGRSQTPAPRAQPHAMDPEADWATSSVAVSAVVAAALSPPTAHENMECGSWVVASSTSLVVAL